MIRASAEPSRKERERAQRRLDILKAALSLFATKGYSYVTMDDVAKASDFTKPTLYQYFKHKADLYSCIVMEFGFDPVEAHLNACVTDETSPRKQFAAVQKVFKELSLGESKRIFWLYLNIGREDIAEDLSPESHKAMQERLSRCLAIVSGILSRGMKSGEFSKIDPDAAAHGLWATVIGIAQLMRFEEFTSGAKTDFPALYDTVVSKFVDGLRKNQLSKSH